MKISSESVLCLGLFTAGRCEVWWSLFRARPLDLPHHQDQIHFSSSYKHRETPGREILNALFFALLRLPVSFVMVGWCGHCFNFVSECGVWVGVCSSATVAMAGWHSLSTSSDDYFQTLLVTHLEWMHHSERRPLTLHGNLWAVEKWWYSTRRHHVWAHKKNQKTKQAHSLKCRWCIGFRVPASVSRGTSSLKTELVSRGGDNSAHCCHSDLHECDTKKKNQQGYNKKQIMAKYLSRRYPFCLKLRSVSCKFHKETRLKCWARSVSSILSR